MLDQSFLQFFRPSFMLSSSRNGVVQVCICSDSEAELGRPSPTSALVKVYNDVLEKLVSGYFEGWSRAESRITVGRHF